MLRAARFLALPAAIAVSVAATAVSAAAAAAWPTVGEAAVAAQPRHPVYVIYDGFIANADGSLTLAFGYYNVNRVEVTVTGDDNAFIPDAADRDQPKVFLPGRQRFACVMVVPDTFDGRLQWRIRFAGHESVTTARVLDPLYALEEASARQTVDGIEVDGAPRGVCLERDAMSERGARDGGRRGLQRRPTWEARSSSARTRWWVARSARRIESLGHSGRVTRTAS